MADDSNNLAVKRSPLRVILLYLVSAGLYGFYWFYVTRQKATAELNANDNVGLQTLGLIVPILNIFIIYWLFRDIDKLNRQAGGPGFPALWFILGPLIASFIPIVNLIAGIVGIVLFVIVINRLNEYWDKKTNGQATEAPFTGGEIAVTVAGLVVGILLFALGAFAAILGNEAANSIELEQNGQNYNYSY